MKFGLHYFDLAVSAAFLSPSAGGFPGVLLLDPARYVGCLGVTLLLLTSRRLLPLGRPLGCVFVCYKHLPLVLWEYRVRLLLAVPWPVQDQCYLHCPHPLAQDGCFGWCHHPWQRLALQVIV